MKSLIAGLAAVVALAGCVAVPYTPYEPAPAYGYYYGPAAPAFSFNYSYRGGPGYYRHRRQW
jgi:hypothetical protein